MALKAASVRRWFRTALVVYVLAVLYGWQVLDGSLMESLILAPVGVFLLCGVVFIIFYDWFLTIPFVLNSACWLLETFLPRRWSAGGVRRIEVLMARLPENSRQSVWVIDRLGRDGVRDD